MANVVTVEANDIEGADTIQSTVDTKLLTGMIKGRNGSSMVMILDAVNTIKREFHDLGGRSDGDHGAALDGQHTEEAAAAKSTGSAIDENQLVSFEVAGQEYAFPIEEVQEIVQLPEHVTEVPNTASHVLGVITLRNRLLPLVSLREMFGLPPAEVIDANKVVVVSLGEGTGTSVGVVMDSIKEVLRVGRSAIDAMPSLLAQNRSLNDIQSICRLDDGKRLVSILSAGRMFNVAEVRKLVGGETEGSEAMANGEEVAAAAESDDEEQFVVFRLLNEEYGVPIDCRPGDRPRTRRAHQGAKDAGLHRRRHQPSRQRAAGGGSAAAVRPGGYRTQRPTAHHGVHHCGDTHGLHRRFGFRSDADRGSLHRRGTEAFGRAAEADPSGRQSRSAEANDPAARRQSAAQREGSWTR